MPLHQYTPGVKVPSGLEPVNPIPVDSWSGPYAAGSTTAAVASANSTIPASLRFLSLEVRILAPDPNNAGQTLAYKYWYRGSTADSGLVEFSVGTSITDYVITFNGRTGAVQGVSAAVAGTGIFVNAATGAVTITNTGVQSFNGNTGAIQGVSSWNGQTGAVSFVDYVTSFNGKTGTVLGASLGANTFTELNTFSAGISTNGATLSGTVTATTRPIGTNDTTLATTAFVQNEIVADTVTTFNGRTGAVQGVSAAVAGDGISVSGATGSVTFTNTGVTRAAAGIGISVSGNTGTVTITNIGVQSFNGNTGAVTGASLGANTFTQLNTFNAGVTTSFLYASTGSTFGSTVQVNGGATFSSSADFANAARFAVGLTSSGNVVVGSVGTVLNPNGDATIGATLTVNGNFFVQGTVTTVNRTDLSIDDKIITLGRTLGNDALADGGGLSLVGTSPRTLTWSDSADAWTSNDNFNVGNAFGYKVNNATVLASGMIHGLSASAGSISGGTWAANIIGLAYGGTNKNLVSVGASGGVVFKDGTGLSITAAGTNGQILQANASGAPTWVNLTTLTGLTADSVKITDRDTTAGTVYLTFTTDAGAAMSLFIDKSSGVTYDASTNTLSCTKLEATVDGGVF